MLTAVIFQLTFVNYSIITLQLVYYYEVQITPAVDETSPP